MLRPLLISALLVSLVRPVGGIESAEDLRVLRALMAERLVIMEHVAASKWKKGLPIEDKDREARVLEETIARANGAGVERALMEVVIVAQIEAAKMVQRSLYRRWRAVSPPAPDEAANLETGLRPRISRLSGEFVTLFAAAHDRLDGCLAHEILVPVPRELAEFQDAWAVAIEGVLSASPQCPTAQN